jgi:hypothetical protein
MKKMKMLECFDTDFFLEKIMNNNKGKTKALPNKASFPAKFEL